MTARAFRVIALTAAALKGEAERCLAAGIDDYLTKPVSIPQLSSCLGRRLPHTQSAARPASREDSAAAAVPPLRMHADPPTLDASMLDGLTGGDVARRRMLLEDYFDTTATDLQSVLRARASGDCVQLTRAAHKIKGAALLVGANELAGAAAALELAAKTTDNPQLPSLSANLDAAVERLQLHIVQIA
jgi:two-component system sensor histidine kinase EvgS